VFTIQRGVPSDSLAIEQFRVIFETSFPPEEREDTEDLLVNLREGERECYLALTDERVAGFAIVRRLTGCRDAVLEYLAVDAALRNIGFGGRILRYLRRELAAPAEAAISGLLFEVERPEDARNDEDRELRERRVDFYRRNGATVLTAAGRYRSPATNQQGTLTYLLMWLPIASDAVPPQGQTLRACLSAMLVETYGLAEDHELVRDAVTRIAC
jgi:ribosomal protein S18 acetylase RimI-like enzyme